MIFHNSNILKFFIMAKPNIHDIKSYIIQYHDQVKANIDCENQYILSPLERNLSQLNDKPKPKYQYIYNELKKKD